MFSKSRKWFGGLLVLLITAEAAAGGCTVTDIPSLQLCVEQLSSYDSIEIINDLTCSDSSCCGPNGTALISIVNQSDKFLNGNDHTIHRTGNQKICSVLNIANSKTIRVNKLNLDENQNSAFCILAELQDGTCANTLNIKNSTDVGIDVLGVYYGKGYVVDIENSKDVYLGRSIFAESGAVGVYVGQSRTGLPSKHVRIMDSIFAHTRVNAIAIEGALPGDDDAPNQISGNIFLKNHWYGLWPVPDGGITTGGQVLIDATDNIQVTNNIIADGYCENCKPNPTVTGIEIGTGTDMETTSRLTISGNYFYNLSATAIRVNPGSTVLNATFAPDNQVAGVLAVIDPNGSTAPFASALDFPVAAPIYPFTGNGAASSNPYSKSAYGFYRYGTSEQHIEARFDNEVPGATWEASFALSPTPRLTGSGATQPIYRCLNSTQAKDDYLSLDRNCEGGGKLLSVVGFSYASFDTRVAPIYRCGVRGRTDHFISWDANCEGQWVEGQLGYAGY
jgi:hypothetical protein